MKSKREGDTSARSVQWFVECNPFSNESLQSALAEHGISDAESKQVEELGSDGKPHDVTQIPGNFVKMMRAAKQGDKRHKFRFWKRNGSEGVIYPADFVETKTLAKKIRQAKEKAAGIRDRSK